MNSEFQIMKQIFQGLIAMQLHTTWQEIFEFREAHIGRLKLFLVRFTKSIQKLKFKLIPRKLQF